MLWLKLTRNFTRLLKPRISKYPNIQSVMRDQSDHLRYLENVNSTILHNNKNNTLQKQFVQKYGVDEETAQGITNGGHSVYEIAHDTITHKGYLVRDHIGNKENVVIDDIVDDVSIPYSPNKSHLKFHASINKPVPIVTDYPIDNRTAYIFNLPHDVTDKQIMLELGFRFVKSVIIKYCMLGLPAYAVAQFISENSLTDKIMTQELEISLKNRSCPIVTHIDQNKLSLAHRQLVLHNIPLNEKPSELLQKLSVYGRVIDLSYPQQIYKTPTIQQTKQLYKTSQYPIQINYHKKNGTVEKQLYPQYHPSSEEMNQKQKRIEENQWKMNYLEEIDIYENQEQQAEASRNNVKVKGKGFCLVTYACVESAQNCYFRERLFRKCQLAHGRQQFEFDEQHRKQLLRHIDHQWIEAKKSTNTHKIDPNQYDSQLFQNFYIDMTIQNTTEDFYSKPAYYMFTQKHQMHSFLLYHRYKDKLAQLKLSIGIQSDPISSTDQNYNSNQIGKEKTPYGKSFSQLAEEQLFKHKLSKKKQRYEISIDKYMIDEKQAQRIRRKKIYASVQKKNNLNQRKLQGLRAGQAPSQHSQEDFGDLDEVLQKKKLQMKKNYVQAEGVSIDDKGTLVEEVDDRGIMSLQIKSNRKPSSDIYQPVRFKNLQKYYKRDDKIQPTKELADEEAVEEVVEEVVEETIDIEAAYDLDGKRKFSTYSNQNNYFREFYRPKTLEQCVKSHIKYNQFVRNTINQYMGVFSTQKLETEFGRKKPTYTNPQNLRFPDNSPFLPDSASEIRRILEFSTNPADNCQQIYSIYIKQNQICKSLNIDIQQKYLKELSDNIAHSMMVMSEMGIIKEQYQLNSQQNQYKTPQQIVKQLNQNEAQFGEQYRLVKDQETAFQRIVKVAKLDTIIPMSLVKSIQSIKKKYDPTKIFNKQQLDLVKKHAMNLQDGQKIPEEICKNLGLPEDSVFKMEELAEECRKLFEDYGTPLSTKDLQKVLNLSKYTPEQIAEDLGRQHVIQQYKEKYATRKASDYSKDTSNIFVKDKDGNYRVSKFRQI